MEIRGASTNRPFTPDEEAALRSEPSTASVMGSKTRVEIRGDDRTYRAEKEHQQSVREALTLPNALELGSTAMDGLAIAGVHLLHGAAALGAEIASPVLALGLGVHGIVEAHEKGDLRAQALARETAHVALIAALDLPEAYKASRLDVDYASVSREFGSPAMKMLDQLDKDPKAMAVLQSHADQGMRAARELTQTGGNPATAASRCAADAAFKEGFDAYRFAMQSMRPEERKALDAQLDARDGWKAQTQVQLRM